MEGRERKVNLKASGNSGRERGNTLPAFKLTFYLILSIPLEP